MIYNCNANYLFLSLFRFYHSEYSNKLKMEITISLLNLLGEKNAIKNQIKRPKNW